MPGPRNSDWVDALGHLGVTEAFYLAPLDNLDSILTSYEWNHSISNRQSDPPPGGRGQRVQRRRRVSITFRTVILD